MSVGCTYHAYCQKMDKSKIDQLRAFVEVVKANPDILRSDELSFFQEFIESFGGKIPAAKSSEPTAAAAPETAEPKEEDFYDKDDADRMGPESDPLPPTPKVGEELSEEQQNKVNSLKAKAIEALEDGDRKAGLEYLNQAVAVGGATAMLLTKRAELLLRLRRPVAAIRDCDNALSLNPDSGKAFRVRGLAHRALQKWERAHTDLANAQTIDFDEATEVVKRFVDEKYKPVAEAKRVWQQTQQKPTRPARAAPSSHVSAPQMPAGMPGMPPGMEGMGGMFGDLFSDPELATAFTNPRVMQAMQEMMTNPAALFQYQNDPEVGPVLMKLMAKMGSGGGGFNM